MIKAELINAELINVSLALSRNSAKLFENFRPLAIISFDAFLFENFDVEEIRNIFELNNDENDEYFLHILFLFH